MNGALQHHAYRCGAAVGLDHLTVDALRRRDGGLGRSMVASRRRASLAREMRRTAMEGYGAPPSWSEIAAACGYAGHTGALEAVRGAERRCG